MKSSSNFLSLSSSAECCLRFFSSKSNALPREHPFMVFDFYFSPKLVELSLGILLKPAVIFSVMSSSFETDFFTSIDAPVSPDPPMLVVINMAVVEDELVEVVDGTAGGSYRLALLDLNPFLLSKFLVLNFMDEELSDTFTSPSSTYAIEVSLESEWSGDPC
jgi:hypothetical protein